MAGQGLVNTGRIGAYLTTLTGRLILAAVVWSTLALLVGGYVLSLAFREYVLADTDARLEGLMDTMVGIAEVSPDGVLRFSRPLIDQRFATPYSGLYWQISEQGHSSFRSRSLWDYELAPDLEAKYFSPLISEMTGPDGQMLRIIEQDIILPEADRIFRFMVATDNASITGAIDRFNGLLIRSLTVILAVYSLALIVQVRFGLRPLRHIRRRLQAIRQGKEYRLGHDWPEDIAPLAVEVDALIDQNEKLVERARTHVGNLAHALKTPLSVIKNGLEGSADKALSSQVDTIKTHIDHHLKRARIAGGGSGPGIAILPRIEKLSQAVSLMYPDKNLSITVEVPADMLFDGEKQDFDEVLGNLIENAGKWAAATVHITASNAPDTLRRPYVDIYISDDGPRRTCRSTGRPV